MFVVYGYKYYLKQDKELSNLVICPNCGHNTRMVLAREKFMFTLFYIPVFGKVLRRVKACSCCGAIKTYKAKEYKNELNSCY